MRTDFAPLPPPPGPGLRAHPLKPDRLPAPPPDAAAPASAPIEPRFDSGGILAGISTGLAAGNDLQDLLARFMAPLVELAHADAGAVRVLDDDGRQMVLVASQGLPDEVQRAESTVAGACGVCGRAALGDTPIWAEDLGDCARRSEEQYFGTGCRRMLAVPLTHRGRTLGVCSLFYGNGHEPPPDSLALLASVGALLGLALAHARLERENLRATVLQERQAIAADVHDSIGQSLTFVKMRMPLLHDAMRSGDSAGAERYYQDVRSAVADAHASLRGILTQFRTPVDPLGLAHALEAGAETFRRQSGAELQLRNELPALRLPPEREVQVFHVVQEALNNVVRHAAARHAWLHVAAQGDHAEFVIEDDGSGLPPQAGAEGSHYGLAIMRERASRLGGTLSVGPREGGGTCVRLRVPLPATPEAH